MRIGICVLLCTLATYGIACDSVRGKTGSQGVQGPPGPSTGAAGGSLTGSYPDPTIASGAVGLPELASSLFDPPASQPGLRTLGTGLNQAASATDARLSDARRPLAGSVTAAAIDPSLVDAAAGQASLRSLGSGAQQAAAGNDARLSDARAPTGAASGALTGNYPSPSLAAGAIGGVGVFAVGSVPVVRVLPTSSGNDFTAAGNVTYQSTDPGSFDPGVLLAADKIHLVAAIPGVYEVEAQLDLMDIAGGGFNCVAFLESSKLGFVSVGSIRSSTGGPPIRLGELLEMAAGDSVDVRVTPGLGSECVFADRLRSSLHMHWVAPG